MQIKLGAVAFDVKPVNEALRNALLAEEGAANATWRDVWSWDHTAGAGKPLAQLTQSAAVPLPNGVAFFVAKKGADGTISRNKGPSDKMVERVCTAIGAKSVAEIQKALHGVLKMPQKKLPHDVYADVGKVASYTLKMHTGFSIVELANAGRNLSFYLFVPGQVAFHHEVTAHDGDLPEIKEQPTFIIPSYSKANLNIRLLALTRRIEEQRDAAKALAPAGESVEDDGKRRMIAATIAEWRALAGQNEKAKQVPMS